MAKLDFDIAFEQLTGNRPFPWQRALYERFIDGEIPTSCDLPTGLGKTSVVAIWLIALANNPDGIPRRLVYVVNRRTVVDQTTDEVKKYRTQLHDARLFEPLTSLCALPLGDDNLPLALSTLRGQFADNREWSADPARPAVIVGTVDMIGSRLLFSGYGVGFKGKPLHAGFLGQDALLIHDESHLEPAFQSLLDAIQAEQKRCNDFRRLQVMALSATPRKQTDRAFRLLSSDDLKDREIARRYGARKSLVLHRLDDSKKLADRLAELALAHKDEKCTVIVFARTVDVVDKVANKLEKALASAERVAVLTGTLRGKERDELAERATFRRFRPGSPPPAESYFLVCTSAGEVGVNLSATHLVCDLSTIESMAQRLGRVNRFGACESTHVDVVAPTKFDESEPYQLSLANTGRLLSRLAGDASPQALAELSSDDREAAFAPHPTIVPTTDILFDAWSLTSIRDRLPGRPLVEPYLHGIEEWQPPETQVAWRDEVDFLAKQIEQFSSDDLEGLIEDYPLKPHEILRDTTSRVFDRIKNLSAPDDASVWVISAEGSVEASTLGDLRGRDKNYLNYKTVLLPPSAGGLNNGMLVSDAPTADDVADDWYTDRSEPRRSRIRSNDPSRDPPSGMRLVREVDLKPSDDEEEFGSDTGGTAGDESGSQQKDGRYWRWYVRPRSADDDGSRTAHDCVRWDDHTDQVVENTKRIVAALRLSAEMQAALVLAAELHDLGKKRLVWQRSIGHALPKDPQPSDWLAKSGSKMKLPALKIEYRHEFGSLLDILNEARPHLERLQALRPDMQDIVLHVVAAHHGQARPHFTPEQYADTNYHEATASSVAVEVAQRFGRLQQKYGRWGLAYLESLLRAADWAASATSQSGQRESEGKLA